MALWWTKRSLPPSSGVMKPKPLSSLNHLTVPVAMGADPSTGSLVLRTRRRLSEARLRDLTTTLRRRLRERTQGSDVWYERATAVMPRGVPSSFQAQDPRPIYL